MNTGQEEAAGEVRLLLSPVKLHKKIIDKTLVSIMQFIPFSLFRIFAHSVLHTLPHLENLFNPSLVRLVVIHVCQVHGYFNSTAQRKRR